MKVVIDTNVLISGLYFGGVPAQVLTAWTDGRILLVVSPDILQEYRRVGLELAKGRASLTEALDTLLAIIAVHAAVVNAPPLSAPVSEDPDDEKFLAAAVASSATLIVSGDKHLLRVSGWNDVRVLKPRQFVDQYLRGDT
jgi:putative PIN family toxin of toxin-antitoxin system